jgi:hypothetical protein
MYVPYRIGFVRLRPSSEGCGGPGNPGPGEPFRDSGSGERAVLGIAGVRSDPVVRAHENRRPATCDGAFAVGRREVIALGKGAGDRPISSCVSEV